MGLLTWILAVTTASGDRAIVGAAPAPVPRQGAQAPSRKEQLVGIVFIGVPGVDRQALGRALDPQGRVPHISVKRMCEDEMQKETGLGNRISSALGAGRPVSADITVKLLARRLALPDCREGFILEDYPGNMAQVRTLATILAESPRDTVVVVHLSIPDEILLAHMIKNRSSRETKADVRSRLVRYHERMDPIVAHYVEKGVLLTANGAQPVDAVSAEIAKKLETSH